MENHQQMIYVLFLQFKKSRNKIVGTFGSNLVSKFERSRDVDPLSHDIQLVHFQFLHPLKEPSS